MINFIPIVGWIFAFIFYSILSVPIWFCYTYCELGKIYFNFLPEQWQSIPFWHFVGLMWIMIIVKMTLLLGIFKVEVKK